MDHCEIILRGIPQNREQCEQLERWLEECSKNGGELVSTVPSLTAGWTLYIFRVQKKGLLQDSKFSIADQTIPGKIEPGKVRSLGNCGGFAPLSTEQPRSRLIDWPGHPFDVELINAGPGRIHYETYMSQGDLSGGGITSPLTVSSNLDVDLTGRETSAVVIYRPI